MLINKLSGNKKKAWFVAFAEWHGVKNPTMADCKLPTGSQMARKIQRITGWKGTREEKKRFNISITLNVL